MKLGDIIIQYREQNGLSQREFARRANLSNSLISIIEKGYNPQTGNEMSPDLDTYHKIALAMGMPMHALFGLMDDDGMVALESTQDFWSPVTEEAQRAARAIDRLPKEQRIQAINVLRAVFPNML